MNSITFTLQPADMTASYKSLAKRAKTWRLTRYVIVSAAACAFVFSIWSGLPLYHGLKSVDWTSLLETVALPIAICASYAYYSLRTKKLTQTSAIFTRPQTLSLGEKELIWQHGGATIIREWLSITEIASDAAAIYFYVGELVEYVVPKRVFPNPEQARQFQELAVSHWKGEPLVVEEASRTWPPAPQVKS